MPSGARVHLVLGDGTTSTHDLADIAPVHRAQQRGSAPSVDERVRADLAAGLGRSRRRRLRPLLAVRRRRSRPHRDLVLVAGMTLGRRVGAHRRRRARRSTRSRSARAAGARRRRRRRSRALRAQAQLQLASEAGRPAVRARRRRARSPRSPRPTPATCSSTSRATRCTARATRRCGGLDYLFGMRRPGGAVHARSGRTTSEKRRVALVDFLAFVRERRAAHPGMHVYHYASYERSHLLSLAARHGVGEDGGRRPAARRRARRPLPGRRGPPCVVGSRSYSIKKLEPLYMGDDARDRRGRRRERRRQHHGVRRRDHRPPGRRPRRRTRLDQVADYNEYDCRSTLRLRDWLLSLVPAAPDGAPAASDDLLPLVDDERVKAEPDPVFVELSALLADVDPLDRTADQTALALAAAAIDYHRREAKTFWQEHFDRLRGPRRRLGRHARRVRRRAGRGRARLGPAAPRPHALPRPAPRGVARARAAASRVGGPSPHLVYDAPLPPTVRAAGPGLRGAVARATVLDVDAAGDRVVLLVKESLASGGEPHHQFPLALTPAAPPRAAPQPEAISEWGRAVLDALPSLLPDPALDLLRRVPPRGRDASAASAVVPVVGDDTVGAVIGDPARARPRRTSRSRAPRARARPTSARPSSPGSSPSTAGASASSGSRTRSSRTSSTRSWRRGSTASRVVKVPKVGTHRRRARGRCLDPGQERRRGGGVPRRRTARPAASSAAPPGPSPTRTPSRAGSLDLLVVDEAGQFSLAPTIASSVAAAAPAAARRPAAAAAGQPGLAPRAGRRVGARLAGRRARRAAGSARLLPRRGPTGCTPRVTAPVSRLSYEGALESRAPERLARRRRAGAARGAGRARGQHDVVDRGGGRGSSSSCASIVGRPLVRRARHAAADRRRRHRRGPVQRAGRRHPRGARHRAG